MFTGIVQAVGAVAAIEKNAFGARLRIDRGDWSYQPNPGDSIAVAGCCLTHAPRNDDQSGDLFFDVIAQTLSKTRLGSLKVGYRVNLESCLTPNTPLGGHFVLGHVDAVGSVQLIEASDEQYRLTIAVDRPLMRFIMTSGSIAVDGVSLTVASVDQAANHFTVALIPTTLKLTTLGDLRENDPVNLEADVLCKAVVNYLEHHGKPPSSLTLEKLRQAGFAE